MDDLINHASHLAYACETLLGTGLSGWLALLLLGIALLLAASLLAVAAFAPRGSTAARSFPALALACGGAAAQGLGAAAFIIAGAHRRILSPPYLAGVTARVRFAPGFERSHATWLILGHAIPLVALLLGSAFLIRARRLPPAHAGFFRPLAPLVVTLSVATGMSILRWSNVFDTFSHCGGDIRTDNMQILAGMGDAVTAGRLSVLLLAVAGSVALLVVALRNRRHAPSARPSARLLGGALVFGLGFAGWLSTRAMAHDGRNPLPFPADNQRECPLEAPETNRSLPPALRCDTDCDGSVLALTPSGVFIDGNGIPAATAEDVRSLFMIKRELWKQVNPNKPTLSHVVIAVPADRPTAEIAPLLSVLATAYAPEFAVTLVHPAESTPTATMGNVPREPRCCCTPLRVDPGGEPASRFATWGDLARAAALTQDKLVLAP
jgi:hypothetical protein